MDHRTERPAAPTPDLADLMIVEMLRAQARTEVHELASRVGLPCERVRARLRRLERSGFIRGYHARTSALVPPAPEVTVLAFVRFTGPDRPTALAIGGIAGVVRVDSLCSGWDFMVEAGESLFAAAGAEGSGELLGCSAVILVLSVTHVQRGDAVRTAGPPSRGTPPTGPPSARVDSGAVQTGSDRATSRAAGRVRAVKSARQLIVSGVGGWSAGTATCTACAPG